MRQSLQQQAWITLIAILVFFTNLGVTRLWDQDEAYFARCAVEMHQRGEWVVPYFNDELFPHKPPFMYWMMRLGYEMFGVSEVGSRFFSALFGLATALLVYHLGKRLFSPRVGFWAAVGMTTCMSMNVIARAATADCYLTFFTTVALFLFVRWEWSGLGSAAPAAPRSSGAAPQAPLTEPLNAALPWKLAAAMYAAMGLAVLVKGPIGIVLPTAVIGLYLLVKHPLPGVASEASWLQRISPFVRQFAPLRIARTAWRMRPLTALAALLIVAGPWFIIVSLQTHGQFLTEFFGTHNYGRFFNAMDNHSGRIWYYIPIVLAGFFPWSIFGIPTTLDLVRRVKQGETDSRAARLVAAWICVWVGFFSLASTKLPNYILPAYPALALAAACFLGRWISRPESVWRWWPRISFASLATIGGGLIALGPVLSIRLADGRFLIEKFGASPHLLEDLNVAAGAGAILLAGAIACALLTEWKRRTAAVWTLGITATSFCLALFAWVAVEIDQHQTAPTLAAAIRRLSPTLHPHLAERSYFRPSVNYYADEHVEALSSTAEAAQFLRRWEDGFLIIPETAYLEAKANLPEGTEVVATAEEFPKPGLIFVLARPERLAKLTSDAMR
ncbi:MAG TPA: glycosyltransferase family 39 protein [Pirellulales bacterium]|jgi:4-amino-4-deoxy-L-arabinose transferase-like glycosyltransferase|nr:glycosyltransferase family 39 protein [Pirellulales bacterium]